MDLSLDWDEVEPIVDEAFCIWSGQPEERWARESWAHLAKAGLTVAHTATDRVRVFIRFLVLASFYRDWCALVWDERHDDSPEVWLSAVDVDRFHVGRLIGTSVNLADEDNLDEALFVLMGRERKTVVDALLKGFGGIPLLFVALWRSNQGADSLATLLARDDEWNHQPESEDDILNDPTDEKVAGYMWLDQGCECYGPIRDHAEIDV